MNTVIIVGASSGIGLALAQRLVSANAVINISREPCPVAGVENLIADVTDGDALAAAFARIPDADALVYCAGTSMAAAVEYVHTDDYKRLFAVNLLGAIECARLALPLLKRADDGRILFLSSSGAVTPIAYDSFYSASKAALNAFCAALNLEQTEVKCTAAVIGGTRTRFSFKRVVYGDCGEHEQKLKRATNALIKIEQTGYTADFVAEKLEKLLKDGNPPQSVTIGLKNKLQLAAYRLMPQPLKTRVLRKIYKIT